MNTRQFAFVFAILSSLCAFVLLPAISQEEDEAEVEARKTAQRFLLVLERNPRKGTALDKVIEFHVDHESLDELVTQLREKAEATEFEDAGRAWLVVGLVEASQGDAESAQAAFAKAEELLPKSAVASFSLGQNLMTLNRWPDAAAALERAIQRKPAPTDLLDVFQTLGRVQQRLAPGEEVVDVWSRLEKLVPTDPRVPELIAKTLLDDGHWEAALPRFESLAKATKDLYRRSEFELEVVDLRLKLGQFEKALAEADRLLGGLKPDHWLFRETRRRVEEAFLAKDDTAGLIKHYEERLTKQPDDFDAIIRLSRVLAAQGRPKDARTRLEAGIKIAPMSVDLRLELIELLKSEQRFADAIAQYEQLDRIEPNHSDHIRDWGSLILKSGEAATQADKTSEHAERAAAVWRRLVEAKPKDAVVAAQVAELMASADKSLLDDAAELLRRAVELEPNTLSHREQLGEVLDAAGKKEASLAAWRSMAEEPRRSSDNLAQLAEVLSRFGYRDETLTTIDAACELDRKSLELRFQQAELRRKWKQAESAMASLKEAAALVDTPETLDRVVQLEVKVLTESELLTERIEELQAELNASTTRERVGDEDHSLARRAGEQYFRLAKYLEAADKLREATVAARKGVELAPKNSLFLQTAAKMLTQDSQWLSAVELYERLMKLDRRFRIDSLRSIAELEQKLGRKEKALKAGRDLLAAAPGNPEVAEFVADISLRFHQNAEALQILRRASRQNAADKRLALKLVERLMEEGATDGRRQKAEGGKSDNSPLPLDEAREILWRVFEQTAKSDDRNEIIRKLAELSVFPGEFTKLTQRLERLRHEPKLTRDAALALVQVHEQVGDTEQARRELERLLPQAPRDVELLKRMVSLSESAGDLDAAITHQKRLSELTRRRDTDEHLVLLLRRAGRDGDADAIATRWLESERDPVKVLREIDRLLTSANGATEKESLKRALSLTQLALDRDPQNWELLVRQGLAFAAMGEGDKALVVRSQILALPLSDDTPSSLVPVTTTKSALADRIERLRQRTRRTELPIIDYGEARKIAIDGRLMLGTQQLFSFQRFGEKARPRVAWNSPDDTAIRRAWDEVYWWQSFVGASERKSGQFDGSAVYWFQLSAGGNEPLFRASLALLDAASDDPAAHWQALQTLVSLRAEEIGDLYGPKPMLPGEKLNDAELDRLIASLRRFLSQDEVLNWNYGYSFPELVARELQRARQDDRLAALLKEIEETAPSPNVFGWLIQHAARRNDHDELMRLLTKYVETVKRTPGFGVQPKSEFRPGNPEFVAWWVQQSMLRRAAPAEQSQERVLQLLDDVWELLSHPQLPRRSNGFTTRLVYILTNPSALVSQNAAGVTINLAEARSIAHSGQGWLVWRTAERWEPRTVDFPTITDELDSTVLRVLFQAHSIAAEQKWSPALREHWQSKVAKAEPNSREHFLSLLASSCLHVWSGEHDAALPVMRQLFDATERNVELQSDIAFFFQHKEKFAEALELLDRIETNDGRLRKEIEQRAVRLAVKTNNVDRLRIAAERLFGMKLEPAEEQQLAATLSGLGLHDHAEAIRQRLPQRAGNNLTVLQQAMQERIESKKLDEACQIAEQIIRRTSPANTLIGSVQQSTFGGGQQARVITQTSQARTKALALLGQQGRLGPLIEQAEQQFDRSPQSLKLFGQLVELYSAAGTPEKQTGLLVRLADSDSPDPQFRLTLARALVSAGKAPLAVPHFLFAIEKLPNATAQVLFEAEAILSELGHVDELAAIVLKSKLAVNDQQRVELFRRIVQRLEGPPIRAKLIIDLFEKAFREAPDFRPMLAERLLAVSESVWQQEEMWPIARDLVVPSPDRKNVREWYGIDVSRRASSKQIESLARRTIELAAQLKKLDELAAAVEAGMKSHPDWSVGGPVILAMVRLKQSRTDDAKRLFDAIIAKADDPIQDGPSVLTIRGYIHLMCIIGDELARVREYEMAARFYEASNDTETVLEHCRWYGNQPAMQQLAVRIVNRMLAGLDDPAELTRQAGSPLFVEAAKITAEINQPYVAARLAQAMITRWQLPSANNSDGGTWLEQLEHRFANARAAIKPEMLPAILNQSTRRTGGVSPLVEANAAPPTPPTASPTRGLTPPVRLDLLAHVTGDSLANLRLDSPFVPLLKEAAKDKDLWSKWRMGTLARPSDDTNGKDGTGKSAHPPDLSLAILASLTELLSDEFPDKQTALPQLVETAKSHLKTERPRTAPAGFHPQLGLWLVARECLAREEHQKLGHELADLATESASLHFDPRFQWAILRERGELAHKAGDKELARTLWTRLAEDVLRPRSAEEAVPMLLGKQFVWSANWANTRLNRARDLCRLTLNAEMPDLSLAIFRDAINGSKRISSETQTRTEPLDGEFLSVVNLSEDILATWDTLEPEWRASGVSADEIFATLLECVLPTNRSDKVFVFAVERPDVGVRSTQARPQSLALRLVEQAIAEKRNDQLALRLAEREKNVKHKLPLRLIQLLLARQSNDEQRLATELVNLDDLDWSQPAFQSSRIATQIVTLLAPLAERREQVAKLFENLVAPFSKAYSRNEHPLADVRRWLAKQQLDQQQTDKAKETISAHLRHMDQVWSATGAMDGQHLRRLELIAIATDYASAGLTREAIDLLAQVADARWPDRYPDENPGAVLAILEAKLKSRPAQERYELWRAWSLPNDGVKSMRMLVGAEVRGQKSEIRGLKSTAFLLVEAAREADRLAELDAFVEEQMKQRPSDRIHVLLALVHFAIKSPSSAEPLVRQQIMLWESQVGKNNSATRTRVWDDRLLSEACSHHETLRELAKQLAKRSEAGAKELGDSVLLELGN